LGQAAPAGQPNAIMQFLPIVLILGVFYLLILRPQQKKQKEHQKMLSELKKGDDVVTNGGIVGKLILVREKEVTLEVQDKVRIRLLRSAIQGRYTPETVEAAEAQK
jgi:preprotein translocase subunit YajC